MFFNICVALFPVLAVAAAPSSQRGLLFDTRTGPRLPFFPKPVVPMKPPAMIQPFAADCEGVMDCLFNNLRIPDQELTVPAPLSNLTAQITNFTLSGIDIGGLDYSFGGSGLESESMGFEVTVAGHIEYKYGPFRGKTDLEATVDHTDLKAAIDFIEKDGIVDGVKTKSCELKFRVASLKFSGSKTAAVLNVLKRVFTGFLTTKIDQVICDQLTAAIDIQGTEIIHEVEENVLLPAPCDGCRGPVGRFLNLLRFPIPDQTREFDAPIGKLKADFKDFSMYNVTSDGVKTSFDGSSIAIESVVGLSTTGHVDYKYGPVRGNTDVTAHVNRTVMKVVVDVEKKDGRITSANLASCKVDMKLDSMHFRHSLESAVFNALKTFLRIEVQKQMCSNLQESITSEVNSVIQQVHKLLNKGKLGGRGR